MKRSEKINKQIQSLLVDKKDISLTPEQKEENTRHWVDFYRKNIDIFVQDFLEIPLHPFQRSMLTTMQDSDISVLVCSRGSSKSFCTAIIAVAMALLYSNYNVLVVSLTLSQSNLILTSKIDKELSNEKQDYHPF